MANPTTSPARLFLVDDHAMVREGLATVLTQAGFAIGGQAGSIRETLEHPGLATADLVVVDLTLGEESALGLIGELQARQRPSLVYSMHEDSNWVRDALAAGASGYVTKREVASCLVEAVQRVLAGERYISPRAGAGLPQPPASAMPEHPLTGFSEQQQRIYASLGEGLSTDEIARQLHISPRTVESYAVRMMDKLNLAGMKALRRHALNHRPPPTRLP